MVGRGGGGGGGGGGGAEADAPRDQQMEAELGHVVNGPLAEPIEPVHGQC